MKIPCVLCLQIIRNTTSRFVVGKSTTSGKEFLRLIDNLPFEVNLTENSYVCKTCLRNLKEREGLLNNLRNVEENLGFQDGGFEHNTNGTRFKHTTQKGPVASTPQKGSSRQWFYFDEESL